MRVVQLFLHPDYPRESNSLAPGLAYQMLDSNLLIRLPFFPPFMEVLIVLQFPLISLASRFPLSNSGIHG